MGARAGGLSCETTAMDAPYTVQARSRQMAVGLGPSCKFHFVDDELEGAGGAVVPVSNEVRGRKGKSFAEPVLYQPYHGLLSTT